MTEDTLNDALLEKLRMFATKPNDNVELVRSVAARLHSRAASQDKSVKERTLYGLWKKDSGSLELLLNLLEVMRDHITSCSLAGILHECVSPKLGRRHSPAVKQLVAMNATQVLVRLIQQQQLKETYMVESLLQELLWILAQVAQKDARFSIKVRLLGATKMFHHLLKTHDSSRMVFPLLLVIKALAKNSSTATVLAKDGICSTMDKTILTIGFSPSPRLRLALNVLKTLSKNKLCCGRMVRGSSLVPLLLRIFERWEHYDGRMRLRICSFALATLQHICLTKAGRKVLRKGSGLLLLHKFSGLCPDDKTYDPLLTRVCAILNLCAEKHQLPVANLQGPASFALPPGVEIVTAGQRSSSSRETSPESDEDSSDEGPAEDGKGAEETLKERKGSGGSLLLVSPPSQRDLDDLMQYSRHVAELLPAGDRPDEDSGSDDEDTDEPCRPGFVLSLVDRGSGPSPRARPQRHKLVYDWCGLGILGDIDRHKDPHAAYCMIASRVRSVLPFVKVSYPDMVGGEGCGALEPLHVKDRRVCRVKLLKSMEGSSFDCRVVYDLDELSSEKGTTEELANDDQLRAGQWMPGVEHLLFESRFESGNLRKAMQVNDRDYNLILMPDVNSTHHHQWFYFSVSNMEAGVPYTFNIINCEKQNSQFNYGMKPLLYSVRDAVLGRPGWVRAGTDICYFRNSYQNLANKGLCYYTATFTVEFQHAYDVCYLAYHYPYTYSQLLTQLWRWGLLASPSVVYFRVASLCLTLNGNETPVLTITAPESKTNPIKKRELVFLTARVHPGESNASWVMLGTLRYLLGSDAQDLRSCFVFKVVPMLNIDGVVNGCGNLPQQFVSTRTRLV
ncbi:cytosolic carboxypeptidase 1-like isoform X2 [Bacillus rossius redtenbacheri]|uniref:cytosolic carboxypeptidase 1-like isoform X2 n=1 Tax=Bacillus rossius redtenbacheri TaxID=93214 RepID=UPI002FDE8845